MYRSFSPGLARGLGFRVSGWRHEVQMAGMIDSEPASCDLTSIQGIIWEPQTGNPRI